MLTYKTEGIVLKRKNFREADRLVAIYTKDFGKVVAVAKGARKIKSKMAGHLEPPSYVSVFLASGKNIDRLAGVETKKSYSHLKSQLETLWSGQHLLHLVDTLIREKAPEEKIFSLLVKTLDYLERLVSSEGFVTEIIRQAFILKFLAMLGFKPELFSCIICKKTQFRNYYLNPKKGGLVCEKHKSQGFPLTVAALKLLQLIFKRKFEELLKVKADLKTISETAKVLKVFLEYYGEKNLNTYEHFL